MNFHVKKLFCILQKLSSYHDSGCCSITNFCLLCLCNLNHHLCRRMLYLHFLEYRDSIVCNNNIICRRNKHLVHSSRTKCCLYYVGNHFSRENIISLRIFSDYPLDIFRHQDHWFVWHFLYGTSRLKGIFQAFDQSDSII